MPQYAFWKAFCLLDQGRIWHACVLGTNTSEGSSFEFLLLPRAVAAVVKILTETGPMAPSVFSSIRVTTPSPSDTAISVMAKLTFITGKHQQMHHCEHFSFSVSCIFRLQHTLAYGQKNSEEDKSDFKKMCTAVTIYVDL